MNLPLSVDSIEPFGQNITGSTGLEGRTAVILCLAMLMSVFAVGVFAPSASAFTTDCSNFDGWSVASESGDSTVNTGLQVDIQGSGEHSIFDEDCFDNPDDLLAEDVSAGSEGFISRSTLTQPIGDEPKLILKPADDATGSIDCGEMKIKGEDFSIGPDTSMFLIAEDGIAPSEIAEGEFISITVVGWSTKSSFDVSVKEHDDFSFDETYDTFTANTSGERG